MTIHTDRLLRLADFIETLPEGRFKFSYWVGATWQGAEDLSCGTTACAIGWATTMPEFRELGLRLFRNRDFAYPALIGHSLDGSNVEEWRATVEALHFIFGIDEDAAEYLFVPGAIDEEDRTDNEYGTLLSRFSSASIVANRIRRFVRDYVI